MVTAVTACTLLLAIWQYSSILSTSGIAIANSLQFPCINWSPEGRFRAGRGVGIFYLHHRVEIVSGAHPLPPATVAEAAAPGNEVTSSSDHSHPLVQGTQVDIA
jgi:hypothetical protein